MLEAAAYLVPLDTSGTVALAAIHAQRGDLDRAAAMLDRALHSTEDRATLAKIRGLTAQLQSAMNKRSPADAED